MLARRNELEITLAFCPMLLDRVDLLIRAATELGVKLLVPYIPIAPSSNHIQNSSEQHQAYWQTLAIKAATDVGRKDVPTFKPLVGLRDLAPTAATNVFLDPSAEVHLIDVDIRHSCMVIVGPTRGHDVEEKQLLRQAGFIGVSLGPNELHSEIAAIVSLGILGATCFL